MQVVKFPETFSVEKQDLLIRKFYNAFGRQSLRPLFPEDFHAEVQVMISLISYDGSNS
jgi:hypothetical protein